MKQLINIDNCLPDYFSGFHNQVFVAYYDKNTTIQDILEQIENEANNSEIDLEYSGFNWDQFNLAMSEAKENNKDNLQNKYMPDCDFEFSEDNENDEFPVAYFSLDEQ